MHRYSARPDAVALISGGSDAPGLSGKVLFYQKRGRVLVVADISGLPQDSETHFFAFHIHEGEGCGGESFSETGGHYTPSRRDHPDHAGDLPPLMLCNGGAHLAVCTDRFNVREIIGKTVVIHSGPDDFYSQPAGNAGSKIACGVICRR